MKKNIFLIIAMMFIMPVIVYGGLNLGMPSAVKNQVAELDKKIREKKIEALGPSAKGILSGTAAEGLPMGLLSVGIKDASGKVATVDTNQNGKYSIDIAGLYPPLILKIRDKTTVYFSIAFSSGTCNVHKLTDLVMRSYYKKNRNINDLNAYYEYDFEALAPLPVAAAIDTQRAVVTDVVSTVLARNRVNASLYDIFSSTFNADSTGFDKALEQIQINFSTNLVSMKDTFANVTLSTFTSTNSGQQLSITKVATNALGLYTNPESTYNVLLASAVGGNPPYTFNIVPGSGALPSGMKLSYSNNGTNCYLTGIPSVETQYTNRFAVMVKDVAGSQAVISPPFDYTVTTKIVGSSVDPTASQYTSSVVDSSGNIHISYYDATNKDLKYAFRTKTGSAWTFHNVDSTGDVGIYTSIKLDSNNRPFISYYDATNKYLKLAKWNWSAWVLKVVDSSGDVGRYSSIAIDKNNIAHIAYYDATNKRLKCATLGTNFSAVADSGANWMTYKTTNGLPSNDVRTVVIDSSGTKWFGTAAGVSKFDGTHWATYTSTNGLVNNSILSMAVDGSGTKWFGTNGNGVSMFNGVNWVSYLPGQYVLSTAADSSGNMWFGTTNGVRKYNGTTFTNYSTGQGLVNSQVNAIAIDGFGNKWFGTYAGVSKFDGSHWTNYTSTNGLVNDWVTSIAVDKSGNTWFGTSSGISKFDGTNWTTYLAGNTIYLITFDSAGNGWFGTAGGAYKFDGNTWTQYTDFDGLASNQVKYIAIDSHDKKWFATSGGVSSFGEIYTTEIVDPSPSVGTYSSIEVDSGNSIHISYFDALNKHLKYAKWNGVGWTLQTIDPGNDVGMFSSITANNNGVVNIAYYDNLNKYLKLATWDGTTWSIKTADSAGDVGMYASIEDDSSDNIYIAYYDNTNKDLKLATWNGTVWDIIFVDSTDDVGMYTSMAGDGNGNLFIVYYDNTNGILKIAQEP